MLRRMARIVNIVKWRDGVPASNYKRCTLHFLQSFTAGKARHCIMKTLKQLSRVGHDMKNAAPQTQACLKQFAYVSRAPWNQTFWLCHMCRWLQARLTPQHNFMKGSEPGSPSKAIPQFLTYRSHEIISNLEVAKFWSQFVNNYSQLMSSLKYQLSYIVSPAPWALSYQTEFTSRS